MTENNSIIFSKKPNLFRTNNLNKNKKVSKSSSLPNLMTPNSLFNNNSKNKQIVPLNIYKNNEYENKNKQNKYLNPNNENPNIIYPKISSPQNFEYYSDFNLFNNPNNSQSNNLNRNKRNKSHKRKKNKEYYNNNESFSLSSDSESFKVIKLNKKLMEKIKYTPLKKEMSNFLKKIQKKLENKFEIDEMRIAESIKKIEKNYNISQISLKEKIKKLKKKKKKMNENLHKSIEKIFLDKINLNKKIDDRINDINDKNEKKIRNKIDKILINKSKIRKIENKDDLSKIKKNYNIDKKLRLQEIIKEEISKKIKENNFLSIKKKFQKENNSNEEQKSLNLNPKSFISDGFNELTNNLKGKAIAYSQNQEEKIIKTREENELNENKD